jgi:hypothetical protein
MAAIVVLVSAGVASGAQANAASYRAQVNALCRSYTPRFKQLEADMAAAKRAGDNARYGYDAGVVLSLAFKEGLRVENTPAPVDARAQMAAPLRLLHTVDLQLRKVLAAAVAGDRQAFQAEAAKLATVARPLNHALDAVGLRDCGSNQQ